MTSTVLYISLWDAHGKFRLSFEEYVEKTRMLPPGMFGKRPL